MTANTAAARPRILQVGRLLPDLEAALTARFDTTRLADQPDADAYLAAHGGEFTGYVASAGIGINTAMMDRLPNLKVISSFGVGLDKVDVAAARARGIAVGYTPDVLNDCVADLAMGLMIDVARRISESDRFVRRGDWSRPGPTAFPLARQVSGAKLGIVGLGRIGQAIAQRATGFAMDIRYHSRNPVASVPWDHVPVLTDLARWCDFMVVITAGGAGTRHLINAQVLDALGPQGYLVNVARGTVVDEAALVQALQQGRIAGAGLDVFEDEPRVPPALFALDNVVLTPHTASGTHQTRQAIGQRVVDNLDAFYRGVALVSAAP